MLQPHPLIKDIETIDRPGDCANTLGYRMPAEFEPIQCVWVVPPHNEETWPGCFEPAQAQHAQWVSLMRQHGVTVRTTDELNIATDDSWIRDFGPLFVVDDEKKQLALHDFRFNSWGGKYEAQRPLDDVVPQHLAKTLGLPLWVHDFVLEGGSIDVNGKGTLLTTQQCLFNANRNPWATRETIEQTLADTLGIRHILWLPGGIAGDDTDGHIDDVARFVSPDCIAVVVANEDHPDHAVARRNLEALRQAKDQDGHAIHLVGLPSPKPIVYDFPELPGVDEPGPSPVPASYANFLIANDAVFVPAFGQPTDDIACGVLEKVMPGRSIVPVRAEHLVVGLGALHCLSMQQPAV